MRILISGLALVAALGMSACAGMAPGGYGDMPEDEDIAVAGAAIPQTPPPQGSSVPPPPRPPLTTAPPPLNIPTSSTPRPPSTPATPAPAPARPTVSCIAPEVFIRKEAAGGVEIKCGRPPTAPPASLNCMAPEQVTWLTRSGVSSFVCMR